MFKRKITLNEKLLGPNYFSKVAQIRKGKRRFSLIADWRFILGGFATVGLSSAAIFYLHSILGVFWLVLVSMWLCGAWLIYYGVRTGWEIYDTGVVKRSIKGNWGIFKEEIVDVGYNAVWRYSGDLVKIGNLYETIRVTDEKGMTFSETLVHSSSLKCFLSNQTDLLDFLNKNFSPVVMNRLVEEFKNNGRFYWLSGVIVSALGITFSKYRVGKLDCDKEIPFDNFGGYVIYKGAFSLYLRGIDKSFFDCKISETNFFPGLNLLSGKIFPLQAKNGEENMRQIPGMEGGSVSYRGHP